MHKINFAISQILASIQFCAGAWLYRSGVAGWHKALHTFAMKQLQRASKKSHPKAQQLMAKLLTYRGETLLDKRSGIALLEKQAESGDIQSQFLLAEALLNSELVLQGGEAKAVNLYLIAAEHGHAMASLRLSKAYAVGKLGLEKNNEKAQYWSDKFMQYSQNMSSTS